MRLREATIWLARGEQLRTGWCLYAGPLRIRWVGPNFKPLFSERNGYRRWFEIGRLGVRFDQDWKS